MPILVKVVQCEVCGHDIPVDPSTMEVECLVCGSTYDVLHEVGQPLTKHAITISTLVDGYVKDTEWALILAKAVGQAQIIEAYTNEFYNGRMYCCRRITDAYPGALFNLDVYVKNIGGPDWIWIFAKDAETGVQIKNEKGTPFGIQKTCEADEEWGSGLADIVMPDKDFHILVEAGHGKRW